VNDRSIPDRVAGGQPEEKAAYERLVQEHYRHVFAVCYGVLLNVHDAEDAAQETMLKGLTKMVTLMNPEQFRPWILRVARNLCIDVLRRHKRHPPPAEPVSTPAEPSLHTQPDLEQAIRRLPSELRVPLLMYYFDGRSAKAIAENLNISYSGACQKLRLARRQLHELLTERAQP
jgi:RNA polymerase sigma-70 factor (ECF subfamily)